MRLAETGEYRGGNPRPGFLMDSVRSNALKAYLSCPQNHITDGQPVSQIPGWPQTTSFLHLRDLGITDGHTPRLHLHFCGARELAQGSVRGRW